MRKIIGVTVLLVFLGVVFTVVGFLLSDNTDFVIFDTADYTLKELTYEAVEIDDLKLILNNREVSIVPSETDQIIITYYESENDWFDVEKDDNQLEIINRTKWFFGFSWGLFNLSGSNYDEVKIQLPSSVIDYSIDITTSNGAIELNDLVQLKELKLKSSNGAIKVNDIHVTDYFKIDTSNGKITINDVSSDVLMNVHTSNGGIYLDGLSTNNLNASTSNGSIEIKISGKYEDYRIEMDTSNGSTYINGVEKNDSVYNPSEQNVLNIDTSNGSIRLNFID